jgi:serine acetyltransferase
MRRYLEVSGLYERLKMNRISSFYKWIGCRRIFNLINLSLANHSANENLKRILQICLTHLISIFENYSIKPTQTPAKRYSIGFDQGFSLAKKHVISEIVQLYNVNGSNKEAFK